MLLPGSAVRDRLRQACSDAGGVKAWAAAHRISWQHTYAILSGRDEPGPLVLSALHLRRVERLYAPEGAPIPFQEI